MPKKSLLRFCMVVFFVIKYAFLHAQVTVTPDTLVCKGSSIDLSISVAGALNTSHYAIKNELYTWDTLPVYTAITAMRDDDVRGPINIGFTFSFLCADYTSLYISSNGWISFGTPNDAYDWVVKPIPNSSSYGVPKNVVMGPWEDWDPAKGGQVIYGVKGTAPYRKFVVSWINVPMHVCENLLGTFQIVIEETTNKIYNNILYTPLPVAGVNCPATTGTKATQGIQDIYGSRAFVNNNRNDTKWSAQFQSISYIPDIDSTNVIWSHVNDVTGVSQKWYGSKITVKPDTTSNYFVLVFKCSGDAINANVKVKVVSGMTSTLFNHDSLICKGQQVQLNATASGGKPWNYQYLWVQDSVVNTTGTHITAPDSTVRYKLKVTDGCSLPDSHYVNLAVRPPLKINVYKDSTICNGRTIDVIPNVSGGYDTTRYLNWGSQNTSHLLFQPLKDTLIKLTLSDNCTLISDTASVRIKLRKPLTIKTLSDTTLCYGDSLKLTTIASGGDSAHYFYNWNNGIGNVSSYAFAPDSSRNYKVILSDGCTPLNDSASLKVRVRHAPQLKARLDSTICKGQSLTLYANAINGDTDGISFLWNKNIGYKNYITINPDSTTQFKVDLFDRCLSLPVHDSVLISVRSSLKVTLTDTLICYGGTAVLVAKGTGGYLPDYKFKWSTGYVGDTLFNLKPTQKSTYRVTLTDNCTLINDSAKATVDVVPALSINLQNDTLVCEGTKLNIVSKAKGGLGAYQFNWNGITTSDSIMMMNFITDSIIYLQLSDGCSNPAFDTMKINTEAFPKVDYSYSELSNCASANIIFSNQSVYKTGSKFIWDFGDGKFDNDSNVSHKFTSPGNHFVRLSITSAIGCADSITKSIPVTIPQGILADFTSTHFTTDIMHPNFTFKSLSADSLKLSWIFGNTGLTSSSKNPTISFNDTGTFLITLIVENSLGCSDTISKTVRVNDVYSLYVPNSFTPNRDGLNDVFKPIVTGVNEFKMYVFDRNGMILFESNNIENGWNGMIQNTSEWPSQNVFSYEILATDLVNKTHRYSGTVTVVR